MFEIKISFFGTDSDRVEIYIIRGIVTYSGIFWPFGRMRCHSKELVLAGRRRSNALIFCFSLLSLYCLSMVRKVNSTSNY